MHADEDHDYITQAASSCICGNNPARSADSVLQEFLHTRPMRNSAVTPPTRRRRMYRARRADRGEDRSRRGDLRLNPQYDGADETCDQQERAGGDRTNSAVGDRGDRGLRVRRGREPAQSVRAGRGNGRRALRGLIRVRRVCPGEPRARPARLDGAVAAHVRVIIFIHRVHLQERGRLQISRWRCVP